MIDELANEGGLMNNMWSVMIRICSVIPLIYLND
jgi:hypothetical protein